MIAPLYVLFMIALGLLTVYVDSERHPLPRRQILADVLGAIWLFLLAFGTFVLITS